MKLIKTFNEYVRNRYEYHTTSDPYKKAKLNRSKMYVTPGGTVYSHIELDPSSEQYKRLRKDALKRAEQRRRIIIP